jgi:hypothetical protein
MIEESRTSQIDNAREGTRRAIAVKYESRTAEPFHNPPMSDAEIIADSLSSTKSTDLCTGVI